MNENRQEWRTWARVLHRWGLENAAASVLEALGPLAVVGAQLVYLTQPIASVFLPDKHLQAFAELLEEPDEIREFSVYLRNGEDARESS